MFGRYAFGATSFAGVLSSGGVSVNVDVTGISATTALADVLVSIAVSINAVGIELAASLSSIGVTIVDSWNSVWRLS